MKLRTDFVTNSSSSSFIITYKKEDKDKIENFGIEYKDLPDNIKEDYYPSEIEKGLMKKILDNGSRVEIANENDILKMIKTEFIWEDLEDMQIMVSDEYSPLYKKYIEKLDKYIIQYFEYISDCSDFYDQLYLLEDIINSNDKIKELVDIEIVDH